MSTQRVQVAQPLIVAQPAEVNVNEDGHAEALVSAARELGVLGLTDAPGDQRDPEWILRLAAAISGNAEAHAMVQASRLAARGRPEPAELVDAMAFRAAGIRGRNTSAMWALWTLSRLRARINALEFADDGPALGAAVAASTALHAILSASVADSGTERRYRDDCLEIARRSLAEAENLLKD